MGRLIDADELIKQIWKKHKETENAYDLCVDELKEVFCGIVAIVDELPTAYDPDKVVEQLKDEVKEYDKRIERRNEDCYFDETEKIKALEERARGIERAIEIVKGMNREVKKKILPEYFEAIVQDKKKFEIRKDEDKLQIGDIVVFMEWNGEAFTGRRVKREIGYILRDIPQYGLMPGYMIFGW